MQPRGLSANSQVDPGKLKDVTTVETANAAPTLPAPRRRILTAALTTIAAASSGLAILLALPPYDLWWLAPVGVALFASAVHRRRPRTGALLGALAGLALFVPLLSWTNLEIGNLPWLLLAGLQAAFIALLGAAAAACSPLADRWPWTWPLLTAALWVGQEALRSRIPFGGFPWGRLAFSQADSPALGLAALGGAPAVTFAVALAGGLLTTAVWRCWPPGRGLATAAALTCAAAVTMLAGQAVPTPPPGNRSVTVAIVQGNVPRLGLDFNAQRRAVLDNHVEATLALARDAAAGRTPQPDLVVWPENASDIDPLANADAAARITEAVTAIDAPLLVGGIVRGPHPDEVRNVGLVWTPEHGPGQMYTKRHPVPFAEYVPLRPLVYPIARRITEEVDRVAGFTAGDTPGVLRMGPALVGDVICFEVAYDGIVRDPVTSGAQLLAVQTNNATFNEAEARQQLAMVRRRAVEHGREAHMASTVGISGIVHSHGQIYNQTAFFTQDVPVRTLSLAESRTLATTVG